MTEQLLKGFAKPSKNKYRTDSLRLEGYDYSSEGIYFITICTKNGTPYFRIIVNDEMILTDAGKVIADEWIKTALALKKIIYHP